MTYGSLKICDNCLLLDVVKVCSVDCQGHNEHLSTLTDLFLCVDLELVTLEEVDETLVRQLEELFVLNGVQEV